MDSRFLANVQVLHFLDVFVQVQFFEIFLKRHKYLDKTMNSRHEILQNIH